MLFLFLVPVRSAGQFVLAICGRPPKYRLQVASELNAAILASQSEPTAPRLPNLVRRLTHPFDWNYCDQFFSRLPGKLYTPHPHSRRACTL